MRYYVEITDAEKIECTIEWLKTQDYVHGWSKNLRVRLGNNLRGNPKTYITVSVNGTLDSSNIEPTGTQIIVRYERGDWCVNGFTLSRKIVEFDGKRYYAEELEEALRGCEVK
ncbi:hypothetical protein VPHD148_0098 [Vibrio phage D148]